jgi:beta-N-acetylhexosaminidase
MKKIILSLSLFSLLLSACGRQPSKEEKELKEKIAQMLMVGFRGTELSNDNHIYNDIKDLKIGGVILFEYDAPTKTRPRNIESEEQIAKLITDMQAIAETNLLISIDQEGGKVNRLKETYGFPPTVSAQYLGRLNNPDTTMLWADRTAELLSRMGINLNFAPSVDINVNPDNPIIGKIERSFSGDPRVVTDNARIWVAEHKKCGIIGSLKHFPGHGSSRTDTHHGLTDVTDAWTEAELLPYKTLISEGGCDMIMTSHVFNSKLDPEYPATMSKAILTGILRERLGYKGVIVTDDMAMGAIVEHYSFEEALEKTVNAGADILILSNNGKEYDPDVAKKAIDIIYRLVDEGKIDKQTVENAYNRIITLKKSYGIS